MLLSVMAFIGGFADAATVSIDVRGSDGSAITEGVVMIETTGGARPPVRGPYMMEQKNISFQPHILIVPVGATVSFPNRDTVRHHVYSFSKAKKFDIKLYGREEQRTVLFDQSGVVALGCNIHDSMSGFIIVSATPYVAKIGAGGRVTIPDVPPGAATLRIWSPAIRAPGNVMTQAATIAPGGLSTTVTVRK